jgi:hypothetical protein
MAWKASRRMLTKHTYQTFVDILGLDLGLGSAEKETNYEHNYVTDPNGMVMSEKCLHRSISSIHGMSITEKYLELGERMLLALQGIDLGIESLHKHHEAQQLEELEDLV